MAVPPNPLQAGRTALRGFGPAGNNPSREGPGCCATRGSTALWRRGACLTPVYGLAVAVRPLGLDLLRRFRQGHELVC